jgi:hypothetical protein
VQTLPDGTPYVSRWHGGDGLSSYTGMAKYADCRSTMPEPEAGNGFPQRAERPSDIRRRRRLSYSPNAITLRAWREANPEKYAAQKAKQRAKRLHRVDRFGAAL